MNCFMSYNPNVAKEVKITTWIKEFDGASPVYPSFPNEGDCFIVFDTDEAKEPSVNKTYTSGEWADTSSGGGGTVLPIFTKDAGGEWSCNTTYSDLYTLIDESDFITPGNEKTYPSVVVIEGEGAYPGGTLYLSGDNCIAADIVYYYPDGTILEQE